MATGLGGAEAVADELRPGGAAEVAFELAALQLLQVRRLGQQHQLVDGLDVHILHPAKVHAHPQV